MEIAKLFQKKNPNGAHPINTLKDLVDFHYTHPRAALAYETLKNNVYLSNSQSENLSVLVTSAHPLEGKTSVALHLAISLMLARKKVLLVDADLRKPSLHKIFNISNEKGFADILTGAGNPMDSIHPIIVGKPGDRDSHKLDVVPSGRVSVETLKLFDGKIIKSALNEYQNQYDAVILDTPPILPVSDALILGPLVQGTILVLSAGDISEEDAKTAKSRLEKCGAKILGVVMNRFEAENAGSESNDYMDFYRSPSSRD